MEINSTAQMNDFARRCAEGLLADLRENIEDRPDVNKLRCYDLTIFPEGPRLEFSSDFYEMTAALSKLAIMARSGEFCIKLSSPPLIVFELNRCVTASKDSRADDTVLRLTKALAELISLGRYHILLVFLPERT